MYSNLVIKHDLALSNRRANLPTISQNFPYIMDIEFVYLLKTQKHIKRAPKIDNAREVKSSISFPVVQIETRYTFLCCITKNQKCTNYKFCFAELFFYVYDKRQKSYVFGKIHLRTVITNIYLV